MLLMRFACILGARYQTRSQRMSSQDGSPERQQQESHATDEQEHHGAVIFRPGNAKWAKRRFEIAISNGCTFQARDDRWPQAGSGNITAQLDDLEAQVTETIKSEVAALSELHHKLDQLVAAQAGGVVADGQGTELELQPPRRLRRGEDDADRLDAELVDGARLLEREWPGSLASGGAHAESDDRV